MSEPNRFADIRKLKARIPELEAERDALAADLTVVVGWVKRNTAYEPWRIGRKPLRMGDDIDGEPAVTFYFADDEARTLRRLLSDTEESE